MIVRLEPITAIVVAVLLGWAWNTATAPGPVCQVQEQHQGKTVLVPHPCDKVLSAN
jgi:hypothetical protein